MQLFIKQKVFSWGDKFFVKNQYEEDVFYVQGEAFSIGKKLRIYDMGERELVFIKQKVLTFLPRYYIYQNEETVAEVVKKISLLKQKYIVNGLDYTIDGDFLAHEYEVKDNTGNTIMTVSKKWMTWGDTYVIDTFDIVDPAIAVSLVVIIDACLAAEAQAAAN